MKPAVPCLLILSIGSGATASAQSALITSTFIVARCESSPGTPRASKSLAAAARKQAPRLVVTDAVGGQANRATSHAPKQGDAVAFALGATAGGILGFGVTGHMCHCESSTGAFVGMAVGGVGGLLLFRVLTK